MTTIIKICSIHGELTENQAYRRKPPRTEIVCKKCNNTKSSKYRYITVSDDVIKRKCSRCKEIKPKSDFKPYQWKLTSPYCDLCRKANSTNDYHKNRSHLKCRFGLTLEQYNSMLESQNYTCAICKQPEIQNKRLSVDHCHKTGIIRGILCQRCNQGLGIFRDDETYLKSAIEYLNKLSLHQIKIF